MKIKVILLILYSRNRKNGGLCKQPLLAQNHERQLHGLKLNKIFIDRVSGKNINRPELMNLLEYARDDGIVYIHSMDRCMCSQT